MHKFKHASCCSLLKPIITKYREPNERNAKGCSVTISFHLSWGEETYLKVKRSFKILQTCFAARPRVQINSSRWSERSEFLDHCCSHFNDRGVTNRSKSWIQLWSNNVHYHFCFLKFKSLICIQISLESATIVMFSRQLKAGKILHQKGLRTLYSLIFHSETTLTLICILPFYFKSQSSDFFVFGMKTRPFKLIDFARSAPL